MAIVQVQYRIEDKLARIVGRTTTAPAHLDKIDTLIPEDLLGHKEAVRSGAGSKGYDRWVLDQQHGVFYGSSLSLLLEGHLFCQHNSVVRYSQIHDLD